MRNYKKIVGMTLIEIIMAIAIIGIIASTLLPAIVFTTQGNQHNRIALVAQNLANERMEEIRGLSFQDIGTIGGNPNGTIPQNFNKIVGGRTYNINTTINWIDQST